MIPSTHTATLLRLSLAFAATFSLAGTASAQPRDPKLVRAEKLFLEGREALEAGRFAEACPKFEESQRLDAGTGTLLALALCHEGERKFATAYRELGEAAEASEAQKRTDRASMARKRMKALEPRLSKVVVSLGAEPPARLEIRVDGIVVPPSRWNQPIHIDVGPHVVEASAPGKRTWRANVTSKSEGEQLSVQVPRLIDNDLSPSGGEVEDAVYPPAEDSPPTSSAPSRRTLGFVLGGAGLAAIGVGAFFGVSALSKNSDATALCPESPCANREGVDLNAAARTHAWIANISIGLGLVAVGVGTYFVLKPETPPTTGATVLVPSVGPKGADLTLRTTF